MAPRIRAAPRKASSLGVVAMVQFLLLATNRIPQCSFSNSPCCIAAAAVYPYGRSLRRLSAPFVGKRGGTRQSGTAAFVSPVVQAEQVPGILTRGGDTSPQSSSSSSDPRNHEYDDLESYEDDDRLPLGLSDHDGSEVEEDLIPVTEEEWFDTVSKEPITEWEDEEDDDDDDFFAAAAEDEEEDDIQIEVTTGKSAMADDGGGDDADDDEEEAFGNGPPAAAEDDRHEEEEEIAAPSLPAAATTTSSSFAAAAVLAEDSTVDENDSAAYVDRMELADAYDEDAVNLDTDGHSTDAGGGVAEATTIGSTSAAAPSAPSSSSNTIPVAASIDNATRKTLMKELKYRRHEVDAMQPEIAAVVAAKKLHRPFEGMPANWYKAGSKVKQSPHPVIRLLPKLVLPAVATVLAVAKGSDLVEAVQERTKTRTSSTLLASSSSSPSPEMKSSDNASDVVDDNDTSGSEPLVPLHDEPLIEANEHTTSVDQPHPHSVKPKQPNRASEVEDEVDVTWLDKWITALERQIKAFLRWEI